MSVQAEIKEKIFGFGFFCIKITLEILVSKNYNQKCSNHTFFVGAFQTGSEERKRMDYTTFIYTMQNKVKENMRSNITVEVHRAVKNNGTIRMGLMFNQMGVNISPTIYLEEFYEQYLDGESISTLVQSVLDIYERVKVKQSIQYNNILDYSKIKDRIVYKVISLECNKELLKEIPHDIYMDLAVVYYALMDTTEFGTASLMIKNEHLKGWKVSEKDMKEAARVNTPKLLPMEIMMLNDTMLILTNKAGSMGAGVILYENILKHIRNMLGENFYVLPSSIHEVILVPESFAMERDELKEMVQQINRTGVEPEDVLSDNVYYYSGQEERLLY